MPGPENGKESNTATMSQPGSATMYLSPSIQVTNLKGFAFGSTGSQSLKAGGSHEDFLVLGEAAGEWAILWLKGTLGRKIQGDKVSPETQRRCHLWASGA